MATLFYKPADGWAGDVIPFFWQGEFHLFYLKDFRDEAGHGPGMSWEHIGTRDFVTYTEYPTALPRGARDDRDLSVFTGSVVEREGIFHTFYTGHNPLLREQGLGQEVIMHATSPDLVHWQKDPANPVLAPDPARYEEDDWRDPFVIWNEDACEYWMLLAARFRQGPWHRRGLVALASSPDLSRWTVREPLWTPALYHTHECPDLFRIGDWWYLVYSAYTERLVTHYRMSRSLSGPWLGPADDVFDVWGWYAAKTVAGNGRRFVVGWNGTREKETDGGAWEWGGNIVAHEVVQAPDGSLRVKLPAEVESAFATPAAMTLKPEFGRWRMDGGNISGGVVDSYAACRLGPMPSRCLIRARLVPAPGTRSAGILLRVDGELEGCYEVRYEPGLSRLAFDRWPRSIVREPFVLSRPLVVAANAPIELRIVIDGTVVEVYANDEVALSARTYDHRVGDWGLFVYEGQATFDQCTISEAT